MRRPPRRHAPMLQARRAVRVSMVLACLGLAASAVEAAPRGGGKSWEDLSQSRAVGPPVLAVVALRQQRITVYDAQGMVLRAPVSTGRSGYDTPTGVYSILEKKAEHFSNIYDDAPMPFMQRITWSGIALHEGALPGYAASHGCVRLPRGFAEHLFGFTRRGMRVVVAQDDVGPTEMANPALFQPSMASPEQPEARAPGGTAEEGADARVLTVALTDPPAPAAQAPMRKLVAIAAELGAAAEAATKAADRARLLARQKAMEMARLGKAHRMAFAAGARAEAELRDAEMRLQSAASPEANASATRAIAAAADAVTEAQKRTDAADADLQEATAAAERLREAAAAAEAARAAAASAAREASVNAAPASVFISRKTRKLYVRQANAPRFDAEIGIERSEEPLGTYVFMALDNPSDSDAVRWSMLSLKPATTAKSADRHRKSRHASVAEPLAADTSAAKAALDRITIPKEVAARVAELIRPGASVIVSDEAMSPETGPGTDFIVQPDGATQTASRGRSVARFEAFQRSRPMPSSGGFLSWW